MTQAGALTEMAGRTNGQGARLSHSGDVRPLLAHVLDQVECTHVALTGGEPLLREDLDDLVSSTSDMWP